MAAATLRLQEQPYDADALAESLNMSSRGVSLLDLKSSLTRRGLSVTAYRDFDATVGLASLRSSEQLILLTMTASDAPHYVIVMRTNAGDYVMIDPPHSVVRFQAPELSQVLVRPSQGWVALHVRSATDAKVR